MLVSPTAAALTARKLVESRWVWGKLNEYVVTRSFYFGEDHKIKVYMHENEQTWSIIDGVLHIFSNAGKLSWRFDIIFEQDGRLTLVSKHQPDRQNDVFFYLTEYVKAACAQAVPGDEVAEGAPGDDGIRLVIWDLDDTYWTGTLSEGPVTHVDEHARIVAELTRRGIVNSICSKNDFGPVETELRAKGVWDRFVFPAIGFMPKGQMVASIIRDMQLRAPTVLFIDDNPLNLHEVEFYNPGINTGAPEVIAGLLSNPRLRGKPDLSEKRLQRYKILEQKKVDRDLSQTDNRAFLLSSEIKVSVHHDIEEQFERIHELVNRTNQLNFTKNRWPENIDEARATFRDETGRFFPGNSGYIKVSDRYGAYGIVGFFLAYGVDGGTCQHFLFSCRTMHMGIEQFVWRMLKRPYVPVRGDVASDYDSDADWITLVADADTTQPGYADRTICLRGACDMMMLSNFLRTKHRTIEEFQYPYKGWELVALPRIVAAHREAATAANAEVLARLPGIPAGRFETDIVDGTSDAYVLSFSSESFCGYYRSRTTGLVVPMSHGALVSWDPYVKHDYTAISYADLVGRGIGLITEAEWAYLRDEFEFLGGFERGRFEEDVRTTFAYLRDHGKPVIVIGLNSRVGRNPAIQGFFAEVNAVVEPLVRAFDFHHVPLSDFVHDENDLAQDGQFVGTHFSRRVYLELAQKIMSLIEASGTAEVAVTRRPHAA